MSFNDHLERDAAELREEFGPEQALKALEVYGQRMLRAAFDQDRAQSIRAEQFYCEAIPWHEWRTRRNLRRSYRMVREEIARRQRLCDAVAKAWGIK